MKRSGASPNPPSRENSRNAPFSRLAGILRRRRRVRFSLFTLSALLLIALLWAIRVSPPERGGGRPAQVATQQETLFSGTVSEVLDGDSLVLAVGRQVRLKGIDTPEKDQPGSNEAREALRILALGMTIELRYEGKEREDRYGRSLAFAYLPGGLCLNEELLRRGHAWIYKLSRGSAHWNSYLELQQAAMSSNKEVWDLLAPDPGPFIGNRSSSIFHKPECPYGRKINPDNRMSFPTLREAFWNGFSPCRTCLLQPLEGK